MSRTISKQTWVAEVRITNDLRAVGRHLKAESRDPYLHQTMEDVVGLQFYDIYSTEIEVDGQTVVLESKEQNVSPIYYIRGKLLHITEIEKDPGAAIAATNMRKYDKTKAVKYGSAYYPFEPEDIFLKDYVRRTNNGRQPAVDPEPAS